MRVTEKDIAYKGEKIKILFVCHGNICRSPMAEFILKDLAKKEGIADKLYIASCATSTEEIYNGVGNPIYPPARAELSRRGVPYENRRAVRLTREDYEKYDMLIAMDERNISNIIRIVGADRDGKVYKMMDFTDRGGDVADPWYTDRFDVTFDDIYEGAQGLLNVIKDKINVTK